jgi:hypothetical protein
MALKKPLMDAIEAGRFQPRTKTQITWLINKLQQEGRDVPEDLRERLRRVVDEKDLNGLPLRPARPAPKPLKDLRYTTRVASGEHGDETWICVHPPPARDRDNIKDGKKEPTTVRQLVWAMEEWKRKDEPVPQAWRDRLNELAPGVERIEIISGDRYAIKKSLEESDFASLSPAQRAIRRRNLRKKEAEREQQSNGNGYPPQAEDAT